MDFDKNFRRTQRMAVLFGAAWLSFLIGGGSFVLWLAYKAALKWGLI